MINVANNFSTNKNNLGFTSLKSNMRIGEKVLKEFKTDYPYLKSSSFVAAKIEEHKLSKPFAKINEKLKKIAESYDLWVGFVRGNVKEAISSYRDGTEALKRTLNETPYANCGEQVDLLYEKLYNSKLKPVKIIINVEKKEKRELVFNHAFLVFGIKNGGKVKQPSSWGNEAVIVDPWLNFVKPKHEGLEFIKQRLNFNKENQNMIFDWELTALEELELERKFWTMI